MSFVGWRQQSIMMISLLASWLLLGHLAGIGCAQSTAHVGTDLYGFGLHLFRLGDYYRAITELKRFSLLFPQHQQHAEAQLLIGLALQADDMYDAAFLHFQRIRQDETTSDATRVAAFKLGELRFLQQQYDQAAGHFRGFLSRFPDGPLVSDSAYLLGLSWVLDGQIAQAQRAWDLLPATDPLTNHALALQETLRQTPSPPRKSPQLAGILSGILPGAGHLYIGRPWQALTALLLNGLFLSGAVYSFHENLIAPGAILLYFETGWYLGTINSAVTGARDTNRQREQAFADQLRATYAPPPVMLQQLQAPGLGLRFTF